MLAQVGPYQQFVTQALSLFLRDYEKGKPWEQGLNSFTHIKHVSRGAIHSTKISGNFGPKLNGSVRSNRKSFEKTGPPFEVVLFSRSDRFEFWLNASRPRLFPSSPQSFFQSEFKALFTWREGNLTGRVTLFYCLPQFR